MEVGEPLWVMSARPDVEGRPLRRASAVVSVPLWKRKVAPRLRGRRGVADSPDGQNFPVNSMPTTMGSPGVPTKKPLLKPWRGPRSSALA